MIFIVVIFGFYLAFGIWVYERTKQPHVFTLLISIYVHSSFFLSVYLFDSYDLVIISSHVYRMGFRYF